MWEKLQTYIVVTMISLLVWLYAEAENVASFNKTIQVKFVDQSNTDTIIQPETTAVDVIVRTANSGYAALESVLEDGPLIIPVTPNPVDIEQTVNLRAALENSAIADHVSIERLDTDTITLSVEGKKDIPIPLRVVRGDIEIDGPIQWEPTEVNVRVRSTREGAVRKANWEISLEQLDLTGESPGEEIRRSIGIDIPEELKSEELVISPLDVNVTFRLRKEQNSIKLPRVRVFITSPPTLSDQYKITVSEETPYLTDVELRGPAAAISRIQTAADGGTLSEVVRAEIIILNLADVVPGNEFEVTPTLRLPAGITQVAQPSKVKYKVERITSGTTTSPTNGTP